MNHLINCDFCGCSIDEHHACGYGSDTINCLKCADELGTHQVICARTTEYAYGGAFAHLTLGLNDHYFATHGYATLLRS